MIEGFLHTRRARAMAAVSAILIGGLVLNYYIERQGPSYKEAIVVFGALIGAIILFGKELGVRYGFVLWTLTLILGYRSIAVTSELAIHPSEILLWLLLVCILAQRQMVSSARLTFPVWLWMSLPFWVLAWWPMINGSAPWDRMLNEFRNFSLLIPLIIVASVVLKRERYWRYLLLAFFVASFFIALMGILEYWFPQVTSLFPAFVGKAAPGLTEEGFIRARFSFWGGPAATFTCVLALPVAIVLARWWPGSLQRAAIVFASVLQVLAIYIGGYRSIWLILLVQILVACVLRLRKQGAMVGLLCLVVFVGGYELIPKTSERALSGIAALQGHPTDTSAAGRQNRALGAVSSAIESPLGSGWSTAGWVHSDFLQVAVNLGVLPGLIFLGGAFFTVWQLGKRLLPNLRNRQHDDLGLSLFLSFMAVVGILAMEGVTVLPQLVLPVWFVWAMTEVWLRQTVQQAELKEVFAARLWYQLMEARLSTAIKTDV